MANDTPKILVADDDELDARLTERAIAKAVPGARVVTCEDGQEALQELTQSANGGELPQLVLMDFRMPRMGCLEVLRAFHRPEVLDKMHVVLFSSSVGPTDVQKCLDEGVDEYVEKPTDPERYGQAVQDICRRYAVML